MREFCSEFECAYPSLFRKGKVNQAAFEDMECLSEDTFIIPHLSMVDIGKMDTYLAQREKVYLFEYSMERLDEAVRPIAESLFIKKESWEEVMRKHCISRMTVSRYRKAALLSMAMVVDSYMVWKVWLINLVCPKIYIKFNLICLNINFDLISFVRV